MHTAQLRSALAALVLLSAACGGADETSADQAELTIESGTPHALALQPAGEARPKAGRLRYYGGPVLERARAVAVLWGAVDPDVAARIGAFYRAAVGSAYFDWLSEYDTAISAVSGGPGTNQHLGRGSFAGTQAIAPRAHGKSLTDAAIEKELAAQIRAGKLPAADPNTVFLIHFPPGVRITMGGASSCSESGFCAYHSAFRVRGQRIAYAVLPDMGPGSGCDLGCGGSAGDAFSRVTSVASHELVEATTDPEVSLGKGLAAPLAWYDPAGGEIGDLCNGQDGKLRSGRSTYTVQKQWSNAARACVVGKTSAGAPLLEELTVDGG